MIQSLNFRLADSMPQDVLQQWREELGLDFGDRRESGNATGRRDDSAPSSETTTELRRRVEDYLDAGHGECLLRQPRIAALVEDALLHFDRQRYRLLAWCVMPNHVHVLIETFEGWPLGGVLHSWKSFTSHETNKLLQRQGEMWQREYLDRYVRNAVHLEAVVRYVEENPVKAGLVCFKTEWLWSSARFRAGNAGAGTAST